MPTFESEALAELQTLERYAYHLCRDSEKSKDLVQDTFLKALKGFHRYRQGTNCRAWLMRIMKNAFINDYRRRALQSRLFDPYEDDEERASPSVDTVREGKLGRMLGDEVITSLMALPAEYHTVVILSDVEGLPYGEIAEFLNVPLGTVRSRLHRGRKILAERLHRYAERCGYISTAGRLT